MPGGRPTLLDASAVLALVREERGAERVERVLPRAAISAVNAAECLHVLTKRESAQLAHLAFSRLSLPVIPCDWDVAAAAAEVHAVTRREGLSLADCICLATARVKGLTVLTADRVWAGVQVGVEIELLR